MSIVCGLWPVAGIELIPTSIYIQTVQSKSVALLVPLTCTNTCKSGTTQQLADGMYTWVWPTHPNLYSDITIMTLYW